MCMRALFLSVVILFSAHHSVVGAELPIITPAPSQSVDAQSVAVQAAQDYLKSKYDRKTMKNGCVKDKDKAIIGLDTKFAMCAARFLQEWEKMNGPIRITSAFRNQKDQECVCPCAKTNSCDGITCANKGSRHAKGIAIDVWPRDSSKSGMEKFHHAAESFGGVHFRLGMRDKPHLEPNAVECAAGDGASTVPSASQIDTIVNVGLLAKDFAGQNEPGGSLRSLFNHFTGGGDATSGSNTFSSSPNQINNANEHAEAQAASFTPQDSPGTSAGSQTGQADTAGKPVTSQQLPQYGTQPPVYAPTNTSSVASKSEDVGGLDTLMGDDVSGNLASDNDDVTAQAERRTVGDARFTACPSRVLPYGTPAILAWRCPVGTNAVGESTDPRVAFAPPKRYGAVPITPRSPATTFTLRCEGTAEIIEPAVCTVKTTRSAVPLLQQAVYRNDASPSRTASPAQIESAQSCFLGFCI
jgi:hypothetical protein